MRPQLPGGGRGLGGGATHCAHVAQGGQQENNRAVRLGALEGGVARLLCAPGEEGVRAQAAQLPHKHAQGLHKGVVELQWCCRGARE